MRLLICMFIILLMGSSCNLVQLDREKKVKKSNEVSAEEEYEQYLDRRIASYRGRTAPDFEIKLLDGTFQKLADLKGKIVLLNFWFVACKPCEVEIPSLNQLLADYGDKGLVVLAAGLDKAEKVKAFAEKKGVKFHLAPDAKKLAEEYQVTIYPTTFLIDKEGIIREVFMGASDFDATYTYSEIKPHLEKLLNKE